VKLPKKLVGGAFALTLLALASAFFAETSSPTPTPATSRSSTTDAGTAAVQMTLAGIAYVDDAKSLSEIKAAIETELGNVHYATRGDWELVWGPAMAGGNLVYAAQNRANPKQLSVVIRGTDFDLLSDDVEDLWVEQGRYPYASGAGRPRVSRGGLAGLHHIQRMTDPTTGQTLEDFLKDAATDGLELVVTGHSLGGGLASLVVLWLHDVKSEWASPAEVRLSAYTFAAQSVGNADFAAYYDAQVGDDTQRFVNPLDIVPYSYGDLAAVIRAEIPTAVPLEYKLVLEGLMAYLFVNGLEFRQVGSEVLLDPVPLPPSLSYLEQVIEQHRPNSYLYLLGAPQLDVGHPSGLSHVER
jgi:hypothetical protein